MMLPVPACWFRAGDGTGTGRGRFQAQLPRLGRIQSFPLEFGALETQHGPKLNPLNFYLFIYLYVCTNGTVSILMEHSYIFIKLSNEKMLGFLHLWKC